MSRTYHVSVFATLDADTPEQAVTKMKERLENPDRLTYRVTPEGATGLTVFIDGLDTDPNH